VQAALRDRSARRRGGTCQSWPGGHQAHHFHLGSHRHPTTQGLHLAGLRHHLRRGTAGAAGLWIDPQFRGFGGGRACGIVFSGHARLSVAVSNGDRVASSGCCTNLKIFIAGDAFTIDYYGLSLGSYDMVLGVQWLESLGLFLWDFKNRTLSFERNGHTVRWSASAPPEPLGPAIAAASGDVMGELLLRFTPLFAELTGLPPQRQHCH
jgi:hypothetical protein